MHTFELVIFESNQSEMRFILLCSVPQRQHQVGSWAGAPQFGGKIEGGMDLPCQGTMWWKNSQCGAVHRILENWSYEQDTDF